MENKTYLKLIIVLIIIIIIFSSYKIISLKNEIKELRKNLYDEQGCYDLFYDNENLVILHVDEAEEYCNELLNK
tara:strand:+ start:1797 stop:2018 length:222 start_codon:yes stop_codon:yes gene_type:complete